MKRLQMVTQVVGLVVIGLLAVYGLFGLWGDPSALLAATGLSAPQDTQEVPSAMNYQGILRGDDGLPLTGNYTMTFRIYPSAAADVSQVLWTETHTDVTVRDGHFSVLLGSSNILPSDLFTAPDRFIGVTVAPHSEMLPRQRFVSVPYTFYAQDAGHAELADRANGLASPDGDPANAVTVDNDGNVTASGSVDADSFSTSGSVNAGSLTASGSVSAGSSITTSGSVNAGSITTSGSVNANSLTTSGAVTVGDMTSNGSITANGGISGGSLTSNGDITWSGDLKSLVRETHILEATNGYETRNLAHDPSHSMCALSKVRITNSQWTQDEECTVVPDGDHWLMIARSQYSPDSTATCEVQCLEW